MADVSIRDGALWVGAERVPLFSGEVHYWRLNPNRWSQILDRMIELGLKVIGTYIPWEYHELEPGKFDFDGSTDPTKNLVGFLELATAKGMWIFIRPGPYIYAEWTNAGVPARVAMLPRIGDAYRDEAIVWMQAVTNVLQPFFATQGGRICLFQPDNEMDLFSHWFEAECGLDGTQASFFQAFLRETYDNDLEKLNSAWQANYPSFEDAQCFTEIIDPMSPGHRVRHKDYWRFQHWATREGVCWHVEQYRRLGVDLPMVSNFYPGGDVQNWRELSPVADMLGIDWYPQNEFSGDNESQRQLLDSCRAQSVYSELPFVAELECGVWHGYHSHIGILTPNHYRLMAVSALMAGIKAFNWYMFVGRDNWYYCPINERGDLRGELAPIFQNIHRIVEAIDVPTLEKASDTAAAFDVTQIGTDRALAKNPVLRSLYDADIDFTLFDPEVGRIAQPLMFYAGADWLSQASQRVLRGYVEQGGRLVLFRNYPKRDENFSPCNLLNVAAPSRVLSHNGKRVEVDVNGSKAICFGAVSVWDAPPGEPIVGAQTVSPQHAVENSELWMLSYIGKQWMVGYRQQMGQGEIIVLGMEPNGELIRTIHDGLGVKRYAQSQVPGVKTSLFRRDDEWFVLATNLNECDIQAGVTIDSLDREEICRATDLWDNTEAENLAGHITIAIPARSGGVWRISN